MTRNALLCASAALALWVSPAALAQTDPAAAPSSEAASEALSPAAVELDRAVEEILSEMLKESPETATYLGASEAMAGGAYLGRLSDYGLSGRAKDEAMTRAALARLQAIDPAGLDDTRRLTRAVLIDRAEAGLAAADVSGQVGDVGFGGFGLFPVTQLSGPHIDLPNLMEAQQPVTSAAEAEAYLSRVGGFGAAFDGTIERIRADAAKGMIPPAFALDKTIAVIERFTAVAPTENVLYTALQRKIEAAGIEDGEAYLARAASTIEEVVYPAYARLATALVEIKPQALPAAGLSERPNGAALYNAAIRLNADVSLTADEIHAIGLAEVARITTAMDTILTANGYADGTVGERMSALSKEDRFLYPNTDEGKAELIADLNDQVAQIMAKAPEWFGTLPPQPVEVRRVPGFSEASAPGGYYDLPSLDGSRPGIYWINLRDTANNPKFGLKTLTYHEAVPGHHFQIALGLVQDDVPLLRKLVAGTNAFVEGWALYSEQVAREMGLYADDPWGDLGAYQSELFRAVRLVVDTGMHAKGWSREQAIDYMVSSGAAEPSDAEVEIERYTVWPGQALGYKIGMIKHLELRDKAKTALGDAFDVRAYHDAVLLSGGLPLSVLEAEVDRFIAARKPAE